MPKKGKAPVAVRSQDLDAWKRDLTDEDRNLADRVGCRSLEELEREKRKQKHREEQAVKSQRQNQRTSDWAASSEKRWTKEKKANWEAKQWQKEVEKAKQRGLKEGVLESHDDGYGYMWVELPGKTWKEIQGQYFCTLCEKDLTDCSLEAHLNSDKHKRKLAAADAPIAGEALLEPYCAMVPWDPADPTSLCKKCLLCKKWVQDEHSHSGTHQAPSGSSEHERRLRNWPFYAEDVIKERLRYHPA